jgi:MFS family permease
MTAIILFALARSLYGTFGSAAPPAVQAYVASRTSRAERTKALSLVASSFGLGTALGPALAPLLILPGIGLIGPFAGFTIGALAVLMLLRLRLPDDSPQDGEQALEHGAPHVPTAAAATQRGGRVQAFGEHADSWIGGIDSTDTDADHADEPGRPGESDGRLRWGDPRIRPWLIAGTLGGQAQSIMLGVIGFLLLDRLGLRHQPDAAAGPIGLVLMCGAIAMLLAQWGLIPMLALGPRLSTVIGMALVVVGTLPVALGQNLHAIAMGFAICSVGFGLFRPGFTSGISLAVSLPEQGQAAGIVAAVNGSAYIVSPAIGVWLYNHSPWMVWALIEALVVMVLLLLARNRGAGLAG